MGSRSSAKEKIRRRIFSFVSMGSPSGAVSGRRWPSWGPLGPSVFREGENSSANFLQTGNGLIQTGYGLIRGRWRRGLIQTGYVEGRVQRKRRGRTRMRRNFLLLILVRWDCCLRPFRRSHFWLESVHACTRVSCFFRIRAELVRTHIDMPPKRTARELRLESQVDTLKAKNRLLKESDRNQAACRSMAVLLINIAQGLFQAASGPPPKRLKGAIYARALHQVIKPMDDCKTMADKREVKPRNRRDPHRPAEVPSTPPPRTPGCLR